MAGHSTTPTKRELREQRRAEREAAERAAASRAVRRRRAGLLAGAAGVVVVAVVAAALVSSGGGVGGKGATDAASVTPADLSTFAGIPERNGVLGQAKAPFTVTEYLDLQCPVCAQAAASTLPPLVRDYVRTGKVKLEARPLHFIGPDSVRAAKFAAGAERQGKLWPFVETFYANQGEENSGYATDSFLRAVAAASGVDANAALAQTDSAFARSRLDRANADASRLGINGTPTFTVARGSGPARVIGSGVVDSTVLASTLDKELAR